MKTPVYLGKDGLEVDAEQQQKGTVAALGQQGVLDTSSSDLKNQSGLKKF